MGLLALVHQLFGCTFVAPPLGPNSAAANIWCTAPIDRVSSLGGVKQFVICPHRYCRAGFVDQAQIAESITMSLALRFCPPARAAPNVFVLQASHVLRNAPQWEQYFVLLLFYLCFSVWSSWTRKT